MILQIKKILIPYDATPSSEKIINNLRPFLEKHQCKMVLLTCIRDRASFGFFKSKSDKKEMEKEKMKAEKYHEDVAKKVEKLGVSTISKIVKSDLESKTIVDYAKKEDVDLIIMSKSKLRTYAERVYYNSTVEAVFKKTSIPFLYVP